MEDLHVIHDYYSFFSLITYLFKDKYYFTRPLIALDKNDDLNSEKVVIEYVEKLESFNLKTIIAYQEKLGLRPLYSYLEFMEDMSVGFVQVNKDTMLKKEHFIIDDKFLDDFSNIFVLIFTKFEEVDTKTFNGYSLLPDLEYG